MLVGLEHPVADVVDAGQVQAMACFQGALHGLGNEEIFFIFVVKKISNYFLTFGMFLIFSFKKRYKNKYN